MPDPTPRTPRASRPRRALAFAVPAAVLIHYALRGGSYDIVARHGEAVAVWFVLALGLALGLLPAARPRRGLAVPLLGALLLAAWTALSLVWSDSAERTYAEVARVLHFAGIVLLVTATVDRRTWRSAAVGVAVAALAVAGLGALSRLAPGAFPASDVGRVFGVNRLGYPFDYWNAVAAWGAMSIAMALAWSAHAVRAPVRAAFLAAVPLAALAVYLTYSRQGVAGAALGVALVIALGRNRWTAAVHALAAAAGSALVIVVARRHPEIVEATGAAGAGEVALALGGAALLCAAAAALTAAVRSDRWRLPRPAGAAVAAACALGVLVLAGAARTEISRAWDEFRTPVPAPVSADPAARLTNLSGSRFEQWTSALDAFAAEPAHGIGAGTFEFWWNLGGGREFIRDAHSLYLEQLAELGLPGLALTLLFLGGLGGAALRARARLTAPAAVGAHTALVAGFGAFLLHAGVDWMWEMTAVAVLAIVSATVAACAGRPLRTPLRVPVRLAGALAALVALLVQLPGLVAAAGVRDSQAAVRAGRLTLALERATEAIEAEPWAAGPYLQRALVSEQAGAYGAARRDVRRAVERERLDWRAHLVLARIEARRGDAGAALTAFRRARSLRPGGNFLAPVPP